MCEYGVGHLIFTLISTIFGAALLCDETDDTFKWLFDTFAKAMHALFFFGLGVVLV